MSDKLTSTEFDVSIVGKKYHIGLQVWSNGSSKQFISALGLEAETVFYCNNWRSVLAPNVLAKHIAEHIMPIIVCNKLEVTISDDVESATIIV